MCVLVADVAHESRTRTKLVPVRNSSYETRTNVLIGSTCQGVKMNKEVNLF